MRFIWVMIFPPPVSLSGEIPFRGLIYTIRSEIIIGTIRDRSQFCIMYQMILCDTSRRQA